MTDLQQGLLLFFVPLAVVMASAGVLIVGALKWAAPRKNER